MGQERCPDISLNLRCQGKPEYQADRAWSPRGPYGPYTYDSVTS